ncbi:hypothetical protein Cri9333_3628 [Crinalium epipsammum PCC 9333]|uniref:DUF2834 domain-containing protein n=1 Tax=Crinalium epipsammum PCC 9333 TaxID=1173022 RepID=K9W2J5_9CYAN|nr:hypothetical protein [Crinalium epipsammum]AFZ14446.1 hypothetical protein Cri9333_3628 [Crinalium epipsammum PCC 9333]
MSRKIALGLLWVGLAVYAFFIAPPDQPNTLELIKNLIAGNWQGINPIVVSLFNLLGIVPMIYACLLFIDGRQQKIPASPFIAFSFGIGAFSLLPYLALREPNTEFTGKKDLLLKIVDSRACGVFILSASIALIAYGLIGGNWQDYIYQFQTSRFIHVMSIDFCVLCFLFPSILGDDMARRGINNPQIFWAVSLIPLFGALAYLCLRPPLPNTGKEELTNQPSSASSS